MTDYSDIELFIGGHWAKGADGKFRDIVNPSTGAVIGQLPLASEADVSRALEAARSGFATWRDVDPRERTGILLRAAELIRKNSDVLGRLTTLEEGMRLNDAVALAVRGADILEWEANEGRRVYGRVIPSRNGVREIVMRQPVGPVAAFSPWNGSVFTPCRKIGGALAAGCSIILKAAEETPASTMALVKLFEQAGVPPGVLNLIFGDPEALSRQLISSPVIRLVTFTGSIPIGKHLAQLASSFMKPTIMELGGHSPVIICEDADIAAACSLTVAAKFNNAGQVCIAPSRVFVHDSVYAEFIRQFVDKAASIRLGDGFDPDAGMGPLASERRLHAVSSIVDDAVTRGATLCCGGKRIGTKGFFYAPTVLADVPEQTRILREEPFGPVITVAAYSKLDAVVEVANSLPYGLAGYVFTKSAALADRLALDLECGAVGINHFGVSADGLPFGGVKESGIGREGGIEGVMGYTIAKTISHKMN